MDHPLKTLIEAADRAISAGDFDEVMRFYADDATLVVRPGLNVTGKPAIRLVIRDQGPGIADLERAMVDGYTSGKGLGLGLSGSRRLVDDFHIDSQPGQGTTVELWKWR